MIDTEAELKKIEESTNEKVRQIESKIPITQEDLKICQEVTNGVYLPKENTQQINPKRTRVNLKQNAKGMYQADMTIEDYNKSNDEIIKELIDLKKRVESAIIQEE